MPTYKLTISYDGTRYAGWQIQATDRKNIKPTIQGKIEGALRKIFRERIHLESSGRTDSGVHAIAQVAHFKVDTSMDVFKLRNALNGLLPRDIVVSNVADVDSDFHARFQALSKTYRYMVINTATKPVFAAPYGFWMRFSLNVLLMQQEARCLVGCHNFKSFQASDRTKRKEIATIKKIKIRKCRGSDTFPFLKNMPLVVIDIEACGFLRGMVRNIVGTLLDIGRGHLKEGSLKKILKANDRRAAGFCAPSRGLYLLKVSYV